MACRRAIYVLRRCSRNFMSEQRMHLGGTQGVAEAFGKVAANNFLKTMDQQHHVDIPTIVIADPANASSWEWAAGLDSVPKLSTEEMMIISGRADAFELVSKDINTMSGGIKELLGSDHPVLEQCAKYFFDIDGGKKIRPTMVMAVSYALNAQSTFKKTAEDVLQLQKRLAEITEMIHTASLFHDDVIDKANTRRGVSSVNQAFGNKLAILGGDFLLSRASVALARLRNIEVVELLSTVIEHLVKGEIMQMKPSSSGRSSLEYYLRKNYYKTASLMGNSCLAAAVLGEHTEEHQKAAYLYGTYVGQAFQLIDDALDFEGSTSSIGKAPLADLKSGLATAPTIFASEEYPKLATLIDRKFDAPGDVDEAFGLVNQSSGLKRTKILARVHAEKAIEAISNLESSSARDALISLACKVVCRTH